MTNKILKGIKSRSKFLARQFYFLDEDDLIQEGKEFVRQLEEKYQQRPDFDFIMKSINNFYSNVHDSAILRNKTFINTSALPFEPDVIDEQENLEEKVINEEHLDKLFKSLNGRERRIVDNLQDHITVEQISEKEKISTAELFEIVDQIKAKRMFIED